MYFVNRVIESRFLIFHVILMFLLVLGFGTFVLVLFCKAFELYVSELFGMSKKSEVLKFVGIVIGGILVALQALASHRRAKALEDTVKQTEYGQRQERMKNAIEHLGHNSDSVRLGGAYELFHLAKDAGAQEDNGALQQTVLDILCAHIRQTTGEKAYRRTHDSKPSEEIQCLLTLLFVQNHCVFKGCQTNLRESWLNGADLREARLKKAVLKNAHLQGIRLQEARLQGADLTEAQLQKADLTMAHLEGVNLVGSRLQRAILWSAFLQRSILNDAYMQGAILRAAHLQETGLNGTRLQAADLTMARMQMASLGGAQLQGADLQRAQLHGASLRDAQMQGAQLRAAQLHGAKFSALQGLQDGWKSVHGDIRPECAQLQGIRSSGDDESSLIVHQIRDRANKESDLSGVIFSGGLRQNDVDESVEGLSDSGAYKLRACLKPHVGQPTSHSLPKDCGANTGLYTEEDAEKWIAEYEIAMSEIPEFAR